jgi:hypothetical protein
MRQKTALVTKAKSRQIKALRHRVLKWQKDLILAKKYFSNHPGSQALNSAQAKPQPSPLPSRMFAHLFLQFCAAGRYRGRP